MQMKRFGRGRCVPRYTILVNDAYDDCTQYINGLRENCAKLCSSLENMTSEMLRVWSVCVCASRANNELKCCGWKAVQSDYHLPTLKVMDDDDDDGVWQYDIADVLSVLPKHCVVDVLWFTGGQRIQCDTLTRVGYIRSRILYRLQELATCHVYGVDCSASDAMNVGSVAHIDEDWWWSNTVWRGTMRWCVSEQATTITLPTFSLLMTVSSSSSDGSMPPRPSPVCFGKFDRLDVVGTADIHTIPVWLLDRVYNFTLHTPVEHDMKWMESIVRNRVLFIRCVAGSISPPLQSLLVLYANSEGQLIGRSIADISLVCNILGGVWSSVCCGNCIDDDDAGGGVASPPTLDDWPPCASIEVDDTLTYTITLDDDDGKGAYIDTVQDMVTMFGSNGGDASVSRPLTTSTGGASPHVTPITASSQSMHTATAGDDDIVEHLYSKLRSAPSGQVTTTAARRKRMLMKQEMKAKVARIPRRPPRPVKRRRLRAAHRQLSSPAPSSTAVPTRSVDMSPFSARQMRGVKRKVMRPLPAPSRASSLVRDFDIQSGRACQSPRPGVPDVRVRSTTAHGDAVFLFRKYDWSLNDDDDDGKRQYSWADIEDGVCKRMALYPNTAISDLRGVPGIDVAASAMNEVEKRMDEVRKHALKHESGTNLHDMPRTPLPSPRGGSMQRPIRAKDVTHKQRSKLVSNNVNDARPVPVLRSSLPPPAPATTMTGAGAAAMPVSLSSVVPPTTDPDRYNREILKRIVKSALRNRLPKHVYKDRVEGERIFRCMYRMVYVVFKKHHYEEHEKCVTDHAALQKFVYDKVDNFYADILCASAPFS